MYVILGLFHMNIYLLKGVLELPHVKSRVQNITGLTQVIFQVGQKVHIPTFHETLA